jgi:hypothetical protein
MNVYRVDIEQWTYRWDDWEKVDSDSMTVRARTAQEGIKRVLAKARTNGYLKSQPIEVLRCERIAADVL